MPGMMIQRLALLLLLPLALAACASPLPTAGTTGALGLGAEVLVKKVEKRYDVECGFFNFLEAGEFCTSKYKPTDREEVHCFKTLGGVDCYSERDPYMLAGRSLPTAPRELADPPMPMQPPENRWNSVVDSFETKRQPQPSTAKPMEVSPSLLPQQPQQAQ